MRSCLHGINDSRGIFPLTPGVSFSTPPADRSRRRRGGSSPSAPPRNLPPTPCAPASQAPSPPLPVAEPRAEMRSIETPLRLRPYSSSEVQSRLQQLPDGTTTSYTAYRYPTSLQGDSIQQEHKNTTRIFESKEHRALEPQHTTSIG